MMPDHITTLASSLLYKDPKLLPGSFIGMDINCIHHSLGFTALLRTHLTSGLVPKVIGLLTVIVHLHGSRIFMFVCFLNNERSTLVLSSHSIT